MLQATLTCELVEWQGDLMHILLQSSRVEHLGLNTTVVDFVVAA